LYTDAVSVFGGRGMQNGQNSLQVNPRCPTTPKWDIRTFSQMLLWFFLLHL